MALPRGRRSAALADEQVYGSSEALVRWLIERQITISFLPTPLAEVVLDEPALARTQLRYLLTGGDALRRRPPSGMPFTLVNHYGPLGGYGGDHGG